MPAVRGILNFEWRYQTRQISFAAAALAFVLGSITLIGTGYAPAGVNLNSPYAITQSLGLLCLFSVFCLTFFCVNAGLRDFESGMTEIIYSTPIGKAQYLGARFGGAMLAAIAVMVIATLVLMAGPFLLHIDPSLIGPVHPWAYMWALLVIVVPNLILVGTLIFTIALLTRSTLATYIGGVGIYALYWVCALLVQSPLMAGASPTPEGLARAALLDPFGLSAFYEQTRYWTVPERNTRMIAFTGHLLMNRALWLAVSVAVLAFLYLFFDFRIASRRRFKLRFPRPNTTRAETPLKPVVTTTIRLVPTPPAEVTRTFWPALRSATRLEMRQTLRGWIFIALIVLWAFMIGMEAVSDLGAEYGTHILPTTGRMLDSISSPLLALGLVAILYYAAEFVWRDRILRVSAIIDVTPAPGAVFFLSRVLTLVSVIVTLSLVSILVAMCVQLTHGYYRLQPFLYLSVLFFTVLPLSMFAVAALAIQTISANRWIGMLVFVVLVLLAYRGTAVGLEYPLWHFGVGPTSRFSDMDGFGGVGPSFSAFMLYWGAASALLACIGCSVWPRGIDVSAGARLLDLPRRLGRTGRRFALATTVLFIVFGAALYYQISVADDWRSRDDSLAWSANYERRYRASADRPELSVVAVATNVDLYPARRYARVHGSYRLENRTGVPVNTIVVVVPRDAASSSISVEGSKLVQYDREFGVRTFALGRPVAPGAHIGLTFDVSLDRAGIRATAPEHDVTANGSYISESAVLPVLGYRKGYELRDSTERRKAGLVGPSTELPTRVSAASLRAAGKDASLNMPWATFETVVSTSSDQTALAPGRLDSAWSSGGRRYFRYVVDAPVPPVWGVLSARYAVRRVTHAGVAVEVWYDPAHASNVDRMLAAASRSLDVLGSRYGRYDRSTLRIAEVPLWSSFGGYAMPGLILFTENRGFLSDLHSGDVDLVARRVAHEVSHQWWGLRLDPADASGGLLMVETLAKNSEQLVIDDMYGQRALPDMIAFDEDRYFSDRAADADREPPLLEVLGQDYLYYGKGAVVMNGLRHLLGTATVDSALNQLLAEHGGDDGAARRPATSTDMLDALIARAPTAMDSGLVREWLGDRTIYDLRVDTAVATRISDGRIRISAHISVNKTARRGDADVPVSMDGELIDVAMGDGDFGTGRLLHLGKYRVVNGHIDVMTVLPSAPDFVAVDPFVTRLDQNRGNNEKRVTG